MLTATMIAYEDGADTAAYRAAWSSNEYSPGKFTSGGSVPCAGPLSRTPCSGTCTDGLAVVGIHSLTQES
jgi:hypothetical protein